MKEYYKEFIQEAEMFFVTKFITSPSIEKKFTFCLDLILNKEKDTEVDYNKGLLVFNPKYGQGKSFFFEILHHRIRRVYNHNIFKKTNAKELSKIYVEGGEEALLDFIKVKNLFIDDIGDEEGVGGEKSVSHFGKPLNVIRYVILKRYEQWLESGFKLYATTNLSLEDIGRLYGGRVADRLMQMAYIEEFDFLSKGSFRQIKESRRLTQAEIQASWKKLEVPEKVEQVDLVKYLNEMLDEDEDYLMHTSSWGFIKDVMLDKGYITESLFDDITDEEINACELLERQGIRESLRISLKHAPNFVRDARKEVLYKDVRRGKLYEKVKELRVRKHFIELKKQGFKFS